MQTVAETPTFTKQAEGLFTDEDKKEVIDILASDPLCGDIIPGTGGVRKVRVALAGKGKRGGARVIYYYYDETIPLFALAVYGKGEKIDLNADEKKALTKLATAIKKAAKEKK